MVEVAFSLLDEARQRFPSARYISLISGQDYPIKRPEVLDAFFASATQDFVLARPLTTEEWKYGGVKRINRYYWARNRKSLWGFVWRTFPLPPRRFPIPLDRLFYGSQWWSLRATTADRVLEFVRARPEIVEAFRWTYVPDELIFATILCGFLRESGVAYDNMRHIEWFALPRDYLRLKIFNRNGIRTLGTDDLATLRASPALFARKFELSGDPRLADELDAL